MNHVYLERHDDKDNMHRFYQMFVRHLFDDWSLIKEWGRVVSPGTVRKEWFDALEDAIVAGKNLCTAK